METVCYNRDQCPSLALEETKNPDSDKTICRICLESETQESTLISPCQCSGSMKHVHEKCLKVWIASRNLNLLSLKCDICQSPLQFTKVSFCAFSREKFNKECLKLLILSLVILSITTLFIVLIIRFTNQGKNNSLTLSEKTYFSIFMGICVFFIFSFLHSLIKSIKKVFCGEKIGEFFVKNNDRTDASFETIENIGCPNRNPAADCVVVPSAFKVLNLCEKDFSLADSSLEEVKKNEDFMVRLEKFHKSACLNKKNRLKDDLQPTPRFPGEIP
jgi:RING-variant domain